MKRDFVGVLQDHPKWPEFCAHAKKVGKPLTEDWFWNWLACQKPYWRNRPAPPASEETGWELNGKYYTEGEARQLAIDRPEVQTQFRRAEKRGGKWMLK